MKRLFFIMIYMIVAFYSYAQITSKNSIVGKIQAQGEVLPGATVVIEGTTIGTVSDKEGRFALTGLSKGDYIIKISFLGYKTKELCVHVDNNMQELDIELKPDYLQTEAVVVSASRTQTSRKDAPVIVNVITPKLFGINNSVNLSDVIKFQPGVRVENDCQNCGFQQVRMNGLEGPYTQILIDSRPILSALNSVYGLEQIPVSMIERVEVIHGGGSALFGSNAVAGVINVITKEPDKNMFEVSSDYFLIDGRSPEQNVGINSSVVSQDKKVGAFLFSNYHNRMEYDNNYDGFSDIPRLKNSAAGFKFYFRPNKYRKLIIEYHHIYEYRRGGDRLNLPPHEAQIAEMAEHNIDAGSIVFKATSKDYKSGLSIYTSAQNTERSSYYGAGMDPNAYGHTHDIAFVSGIQGHHHFDNMLFAPSKLIFGAEFQSDYLHDVIAGYNRDFSQRTIIGGMFVQNNWRIGKLNLLIGARLDKHNMVKDPIFSPRTTMLYHINDHLHLRATYSEGYRAPQTFDEDLHIMAVGGEVMLIKVDPELKPEHSRSYSTSLDSYFDLGMVQSNMLAEIFYTRLTGVFVLTEDGTDADNNKILLRHNGDGAEVYGINTEIKFALGHNYQWQTGFTYQKSLYLTPQAWSDNEAILPVRKMLRTPELYGYSTVSLEPLKSLSLSLSALYTGQMLVPHYAGYIAEDVLVETPGFWELNAQLSYSFKLGKNEKFELRGGVQNIFNAFQSDLDKGPLRDAGYIYGPIKPRTFYFGVKISSL